MNVIQQQLDVSKSLLSALDSLLTSYGSLSAKSSDQTQIASQAVENMASQSKKIDQAASKSQSMSNELNEVANTKSVIDNITSNSKKVSQ